VRWPKIGMPTIAGVESVSREGHHFELRSIDVTRSQGVTVVAIHTSSAIILLAPGCVIVFRTHQMNVMIESSNHELDLE
jgi:hypothetical protein